MRTQYVPINPDPLKELTFVNEALFTLAKGLEDEQRGVAALAVSILASRMEDAIVRLKEKQQ